MSPHRLRRGALHLPARRSRQNAKLFLREPLVPGLEPRSVLSRAGKYNVRGRGAMSVILGAGPAL
jgi:hypothetical protein